MHFRQSLIILILLVYSGMLHGQKFLPDTVFVEFRADSLIDMNHIGIVGISDTRSENPCFVRFDEKKKYLLIPMDQEFYFTEPLAEEILKGIPQDTNKAVKYFLDIRKFEIETKKRRFSSSVYLVADIPVYQNAGDSSHYIGTLFYDYLYQPIAKRESSGESTENLLSKWHTDFKIDLLTINSVSSDISTAITPNFIDDPKIRSLYLNVQGGTFVGLNWWGIQGEIYFSRPETNLKNHYTSGIIRYQNNDDYESFAIGKNSEHFNLRKNKNLSFTIDLNILLGFCKWKDIEKHDPTLYQLLDLEVSSVQSILYNPINSRGLTARVGFIENISYVFDMKPKIQPGLFFGLGFRL